MPEPVVSKRFSQDFEREIHFAKALHGSIGGEKDLGFNMRLASFLSHHGADRLVVFAALLEGFSLKEIQQIQRSGTAKHMLQQNRQGLELGDKTYLGWFKKDMEDALAIVESYRLMKEKIGLDINAEFASGLEFPKLRASLLRAGVLNFELDNPESDETNRNLETAEHVYIPWLDLVGFVNMSHELGEKFLKIRDPVAYEKISEQLAQLPPNKKPFGKMISILKKSLGKRGLDVEDVEFRPKSIYSIYQKFKAYGHPVGSEAFDHDPRRLNDLYGIRIVLKAEPNESESDQIAKVRRALDIAGSRFEQPMNSRVDEYIGAKAKPSGYKAIHVPVNGPRNLPVEIHLVTGPWHEANEGGTTSHFFYKLPKELDSPLAHALVRIREELKAGVPAEDVFKGIGKPLIYVTTAHFGPREHALPSGATPLDLWYTEDFRHRFQEKMGSKRIFWESAEVNGQLAKLGQSLTPGDHVRFEVTQSAPEAKLANSLLPLVVTPEARAGLRKLLKKEKGWRYRRLP